MPKKTIRKVGSQIALLSAIWLAHQHAWAELKPVSDEELAEITGQAYISIDKTLHPVQQNLSYTRINLGMDIETKMNAETLELGRYHRWENGQACRNCTGNEAGLEKMPSDILISNMGLGYIHNSKFFQDNPNVPQIRKPDGSSYQDGEIVPFKISDPYLEFAFDETTNELIGARIGFGEAMGLMTGDIQSLTGNVDISIRDTGRGLTEASSEQGNVFDGLVLAIAPLLFGSRDLEAQATLVYEDGRLDPVRSQIIGMPNGNVFSVKDVTPFDAFITWVIRGTLTSDINIVGNSPCFLGICWTYDLEIMPENCLMMGVQTCFPLSNFQTLPIGQLSSDKKRVVAPASGMFISFQTKDTPWSTTTKATDAMSASDFLTATSGAFFNMPTGAVEVNLRTVYRGVAPARQEFIDRGRGLF